MESSFTIGQVSNILGISSPTLRFWEEKGLFKVHKSDNQYRRYTVQDLVHIADIVFFRNLGIPVSKVQELENYSLEEYAQHMATLQKQLTEKIASYQTMCRHAQNQEQNLLEVQRLQHCFGQIEELPFQSIEKFDFLEQNKLLRYIKNPSCYVRYFDSSNMNSETRCIMVDDTAPNAHPFWSKKPCSRFATILIRENIDQNYQSDIEDSLARLRQQFRTGDILAQYLITANDQGEHIDFLKGFVEILPN